MGRASAALLASLLLALWPGAQTPCAAQSAEASKPTIDDVREMPQESIPMARHSTSGTEFASTGAPPDSPHSLLPVNPEQWLSPEGFGSSLKAAALLTIISLAPAVLLMTTCFVRITIVLGLLRQALGTPQLPPNQVLTALSLFLTLAVMTPVWTEVYREGVVPYTNKVKTASEALQAGLQPVRKFMCAQIEATGNQADIWMFIEYAKPSAEPKTYDDVPLTALLPAFMLSELKTAFLIGFQLYLPFLIIDVVVSSVTVSMGMMMLPPVLVSLPLKLLLFVLVDGWRLVAGMLLQSFQPFT